MTEHCFTHTEVEKAVVHTFSAAAKLSKINPEDTEEAQYNIAFPIASALVYGDVGYEQVCDQAVHNEIVLNTMKKLCFEVDPELEKRFPEERLAWVEIKLKNGVCYRSKIYAAPGEHTDPNLSPEWIKDKFMRITKPFLSKENQCLIMENVTSLNEFNMRDLVTLVNGCIV